MDDRFPSFLLSKSPVPGVASGGRRRSFADGALKRMGSVITATYVQWEYASRKGLLQAIDGRVKLVSFLFLLVVATIENDLAPALALSGFLLFLVLLSRLDLVFFYRRVAVLAFLFGFLVALPATLNIVTEGRIVLPLLTFPQTHGSLPFGLPHTIGITAEGLAVLARLTLRVVNCLSVAFLLLHTTPLPHIVKSLKVFRVPDTVLLVLVLTYKYIFIFSSTIEAMYLAMKSRVAEPLKGRETGEWAAGRMVALFRKTQKKCEDVFQAMVSRGLSREIRLPAAAPLRAFDLCAGFCLAASGCVILWI